MKNLVLNTAIVALSLVLTAGFLTGTALIIEQSHAGAREFAKTMLPAQDEEEETEVADSCTFTPEEQLEGYAVNDPEVIEACLTPVVVALNK